MSIQWFPGHMAKAKRVVQENLRLVDVVVEVVDARCPSASSNGDLVQLLGDKPRIVLLNKADLAQPTGTEAWMRYLRAQGMEASSLDAVRGNPRDLLARVRSTFAPVLAALKAKGRLPRPARVMVLGIPNVGKSSVINRLVGGRRAATGDKPGVTKGKQWVRVGRDVELLDLPGILQPKFEDQHAALLLAAVGAIRDEVYDHVAAVTTLLPLLWEQVPAGLQERFGLTELDPNPEVNLGTIAANRGLLRAGGTPELEKAAGLVLRETRDGLLGKLTLEHPPV